MKKVYKYIKSFLINVLLLVVAIILFFPLAIWGLVESAVNLFYRKRFWESLGVFGEVLLLIAVLIDVMVNVLCKVPFNRLLISEQGYKFGSRFDTVSYVLGVNMIDDSLTTLGENLCAVLDWIDDNHCMNAVLKREQLI